MVILGAANVGKTTYIHRYIEGKFQQKISVSMMSANDFLTNYCNSNVMKNNLPGKIVYMHMTHTQTQTDRERDVIFSKYFDFC